mmetsp:Transcript_1623/g.3557  ORF Transcript_1623/g.3557 Transcript_1623/m.3557 type:complete len:236 (-) Transcript_1623:37-744(-)|eukprot:CAMPEP_0172527582 /NCGR_PEP_ID=MMETSP1067-20121228/2237_1 /TAXON_ID=265564 ORGANISM="Thalassiosira punctigera, Strain Tpunct2005C2" /NCGR_SAMPLE_ID=MMETSP1067 /ASSEMBLY_ACC=CAM_ASM_000444 /LENGTH=235 /DNA_ID=CAMNT_0013311345 /DNA_START=196 /DNA_END=903 /DNA_ORIENTATION=-
MFQSGVPFHETGTFKSRRTFLPDDQYGVALDNLVKGCTDILLLNPSGTHVFAGKRRVQPQPDWWFTGGRMFPGETPVQSCQRLLRRELGLEIESRRFAAVCAQAFAFGMRQQEPKEHGTTDTQFCFRVQLKNEEEVKKVVLDEEEYCDSEWKLPSEILEGNYHPAMKYAVGCMLAGEALEKMQECEEKGGSDADIAKLTREFLKRRKAVDDVMKKNDYKLVSKELNYQTTVHSKY